MHAPKTQRQAKAPTKRVHHTARRHVANNRRVSPPPSKVSPILTQQAAIGKSYQNLIALRQRRDEKGFTVATTGLTDQQIAKHIHKPELRSALQTAANRLNSLPTDLPKGEIARAHALQNGLTQFYDPTTVNPFIPLAARGSWIVTDTGSVVLDVGGYGMLGFGHAPSFLLDTINRPFTQANIMTPAYEQRTFVDAVKNEIGNTRPNKNGLYESFIMLNSGSEAVTAAMRISDIDAKTKTQDPAGPQKSCLVALSNGFHGRTERPAQASDSSRPKYLKYLKSYEHPDVPLFTLPTNDIDALHQTFADIKQQGYHPELFLVEATQGEGNPGVRLTPEFYAAARKITKEFDSLLLVDSIQAGIRATGELSIVDYPGFQDQEAPDFESFSKALNGGQFPMSCLAIGPRAKNIYHAGLYGNTMTGNPRGLAMATQVLQHLTPEVKQNILQAGDLMLEKFKEIQDKYPELVEGRTGSGLLNALHLKPHVKAYGSFQSVEAIARRQGLGVIHGGSNGLRFTPGFNTTADEVELIGEIVSSALDQYAQINDLKTTTQ